jgi:hypothetical protein
MLVDVLGGSAKTIQKVAVINPTDDMIPAFLQLRRRDIAGFPRINYKKAILHPCCQAGLLDSHKHC